MKKPTESYTKNRQTGQWERKRAPLNMMFVQFLGRFVRLLGWVSLVALFITITRHWHIHTYPPIVEVVEAQSVEDHVMIEYYIDGQQHLRSVLETTVELVSGPARDFGINPNHLLAICIQEGYEVSDGVAYSCSPTAVGDHGRAIGAFQILADYHGFPKDDAKNIYASAKWTAERMLRYNYRNNPRYAMQAHNGIHSKGYGNTVWQIAKTLHPII